MNAGQLIAAQPGLTLSDPLISVLWGVMVFHEQVRSLSPPNARVALPARKVPPEAAMNAGRPHPGAWPLLSLEPG